MEYRILGPLEVLHDGRPLPLGGAKQRALLAVLLLHPNQVVSVDRLIDDLWGEEPPESAPNLIQTYVSRLRKVLDSGGGGSALVSRKPGYELRVRPGELDADRFERLVEQARQAGTGATAASMLREALSLWRGEPLADFAFEPFAQRPIERFRELRAGALEDRIQADLDLGQGAELVGELQALVAEHPLRERLRGHLMLALYRAGRQAEALEGYQDARRSLADELGIDPGPELQRLERAILAQDPVLLPTAAPSPELPHAAPRPVRVADRSILVAPQDPDRLAALLALTEPLARTEPPHELILVRLLGTGGDPLVPLDRRLTEALSELNRRRSELTAAGIACRVAAFTSENPGEDLANVSGDQPVELAVMDGSPEMFDPERGLAATLIDELECDVAVLLGEGQPAAPPHGAIVVPFGGAEHDWAALHLAAWLAYAHGAPLRLLGAVADPIKGRRDASRLLGSASLVTQRLTGVAAEPLLVEPGEPVVEAVRGAGLAVLGLSKAWRDEGLGEVRSAIVERGGIPTVVLRRGSGSAAPSSREGSRYTWSRLH